MPKGKNCPNCGAVYEIDKNKCPYCGTSYYDMSAIDFEDGEPFYLKIKTKMNGKNHLCNTACGTKVRRSYIE